jgi:hypothetical protein
MRAPNSGQVEFNGDATSSADKFAGDVTQPKGGGSNDGEGASPPGGGGSGGSGDPEGVTVARCAELLRVPDPFLRKLGLSDIHVASRPSVRIPFFDQSGEQASVRMLLNVTGEARWKTGSKPYPYGLHRLGDARNHGYVVIVDGEPVCHLLWHHNIPAIGLIDAEGWPSEWDGYFDGIPRIYVPVRQNPTDDAHPLMIQEWIATSSLRERIYLIDLPIAGRTLPELGSIGATLREVWAEVIGKARAWKQVHDAEQQREAQAALDLGKLRLEDPHILERIGGCISESGYAGDVAPAVVAYIALTSRLLDEPISVAIVGPSAAGKNYALDEALALMPEAAFYSVSAASPLALVYADGDFCHRTVIYREADSIPEDGPAASAIRALITDSALVYVVTERNQKSGRFETRRIEKQGPTNLLTTSTRSLPPQLGTRHLEMPIADDTEQTREIMAKQAAAVDGSEHVVPDRRPFVAAQERLDWLATHEGREVIIPFASVIGPLIPSPPLRMRRDFGQFLAFVKTLAFLRQCNRHRSARGAIIADIEDYADARRLLAPVFDAIIAEGATPGVRETVAAMPLMGEITETELAVRLKLPKSTVSDRVRRAIDGGWLINEEPFRGRPARLRRGAQLPDVTTALPTREQVLKAYWDHVGKQVYGCPGAAAGGAGAPPPPASPDETEVPLLQRLHRNLFRRDRENRMPLDEAVVFLCLQKPELTVDRGFQLVDYGDGILWAICKYDEPGRPVLVPLWNL